MDDVYKPYRNVPGFDILVFKFDPIMSDVMKVESVRIWDQISHCNIIILGEDMNINDKKFSFRLATGFVAYDGESFTLTRCLGNNGKWISETLIGNCFLFNTMGDFVFIPDLKDEEVVVISCVTPLKDYIQEIFVEGYPKLQVEQLYTDHQRFVTRNIPDVYLPHGARVTCRTNFPYNSQINWIKIGNNSHDDYAQGQSLIVDIFRKRHIIGLQEQPNFYKCNLQFKRNSQSLEITLSFKFYVQVLYKVIILDEFGNTNRRLYDFGDTLRCSSKSQLQLPPNTIWYFSDIRVSLVEDKLQLTELQTPSEIFTINFTKSFIPPINLYLRCILQGATNVKYQIYIMDIVVLTNDVTQVISSYNYDDSIYDHVTNVDVHCKERTENIYLFINLIRRPPLSTLMKNSKLMYSSDNTTLKLLENINRAKRYYIICVSNTANIFRSPIELDLTYGFMLDMTSFYPDFSILPTHFMKGFMVACYSSLSSTSGYTMDWECPTCSVYQFQKSYGYNNKHNLEVISDHSMEIVYMCSLKKNSAIISFKYLKLNILEHVQLYIQRPAYFYAPGDPVICLGTPANLDPKSAVSIPIPVRLFYHNSTHNFSKSSSPTMDPYNKATMTPRIPLTSEINYLTDDWKFAACCLKMVKMKLVCDRMVDIPISDEYSFQYNYPLDTHEFYPGDLVKCCVIQRSDKGRNKSSCVPGRIQFYANSSSSSSVIFTEGFQIQIPRNFEQLDVNTIGAYVSCYADDFGRKELDIRKTTKKVLIKTCSLTVPAVLMLPANTSTFYVNETIKCAAIISECQSVLPFNFTIKRNSEVLDVINDVDEITLKIQYLGLNIFIECATGGVRHVTVDRYISIHVIPDYVYFKGLKEIMTYDEAIECLADASPHVNLNWFQISGKDTLLVVQTKIYIRKWNSNGIYKFRCTASNEHGDSYRFIEFRIFNKHMIESKGDKKFFIIIYFQLFIYHVLLVAISYFAFQDYIRTTNYSAQPFRKSNVNTTKNKS